MVANLRALRLKRGISQQQLADIIGVSQQSINKYENHNIEPDIFTLIAMANYFNTSVDYLIGNTAVERKIDTLSENELTQAEADMVCQYRNLTEKQRECVNSVIENLAQK